MFWILSLIHICLLRSEFIYLNSPDFPTEEEQFQIYKQVLERLAPRPVVAVSYTHL